MHQRRTKAIERESASDLHGLTGRDIGLHFGRAELGEVHSRAHDLSDGHASRGVDERVASPQGARAAAHRDPARECLLWGPRLAEPHLLELKYRVTAENESGRRELTLGYCLSLSQSEHLGRLSGPEPGRYGLFVDPTDDDERVDPSLLEESQAGWRGRGEDEGTRSHGDTLSRPESGSLDF